MDCHRDPAITGGHAAHIIRITLLLQHSINLPGSLTSVPSGGKHKGIREDTVTQNRN